MPARVPVRAGTLAGGESYEWLAGKIEVKLTETSQGTQIDWFYHLTPRTALAKLLRVFVGGRVMQGIADEFNKQLAEYAEAHP